MSSGPKIAVLLSTYNGARFLREQLDSLLNQSHSDFIIVVRDDGSTDSTPELLARYAAQEPGRFHRLQDEQGNLGAAASYSRLMEYVLAHRPLLGLDSAYMMFCDQDDTWAPDKMTRQLDAMLAAEREQDGRPVLVHSDLKVVSDRNRPIADSLVRYQGLPMERNRFPDLVISNLVTGCTALVNETLARTAVPVPGNAIMHDWWLALVAAAFGRVVFLDAALVHYRQHDNNVIGAREKTTAVTARSLWRRLADAQANEYLAQVAGQATAFRRRFGARLGRRERLGLRIAGGMSLRNGPWQRLCYRLARRF